MSQHKHTVLYCRVSTSRQLEGKSLDDQETDGRAWCLAQGYGAHLLVLREVHSGTDLDERPVLSNLRALMAQGEVERVVVYRYDRLSREQMHQAVILYQKARKAPGLQPWG